MAKSPLSTLTAVGGVVAVLLVGCSPADNQADSEPEPETIGSDDAPETTSPAPEETDDDAGEPDTKSSAGEVSPDPGHVAPEHFPTDPLAGLDEFYEQEVQWSDCAEEMHCGSVEVPRDYADPAGERITIEFVSDTLDDQPFVVMNPGGPGSSGYEMVADQANLVFSSRLREESNIIGFDPRGVARSEPLECMDDSEYEEWNQETGEAGFETDVDLSSAELAEVVAQCQERSGDIIEHIDTISSARDMDILRAAIGEEQLHYFGMSYGTKLGLAYAEMFPDQVGRWVLDGVMDVSVSLAGIAGDQAVGFERELWRFAEWCAGREECPISGDAQEVFDGISELTDEIREEPVTATDGRQVTANTIFGGLSTTMYIPGGREVLLEALQLWVDEANPEYFQQISDIADGRNADGTYDWISSWSFRAIMCSDYPPEGEGLNGPGLLEGEDVTYTEQFLSANTEFCDALPGERAGEPWEPSEELPQMLLIGGTQDPATPVEWAENTHRMLPNSSLLIYDGDGHISYGLGNTCVNNIADDYLIDGELFDGRQDC
ncbi:alpha/beta hydrolase [Nesterenkonia natronophila]|uniref:Alpha/beta hydrolase n=1 Tax=Nesterenkonia natronophila TaxID=2174932 RepID=A0A3A4F181_9MICC|nr:alpha/beta hydrolase [Nesterenkonia natronophila]RJN31992.1 alpha/beta hydrolase [Nesterenkonia natronophila]